MKQHWFYDSCYTTCIILIILIIEAKPVKNIESRLKKKDLGVLVDEKLNMTHQCVLTAQKANCTLGCIQSSVASRVRDGILALCSALVRPHLQSCIQLWSPQHRTDMDLLERGQRRPQK